ncbi:sterol desaturase family protein, partial [Escherichia coli]|uniref:sterol desaturase family protein n=1 Tax=Escherichia coli TaxID=562 RepID=UPI002281B414
ALLASDFGFYWLHRLHHRFRLLWAVHVVHHQGEHFNLSLGVRNSWYSSLTSIPFFLLLALAGVPRPSVKSSTPTSLQYARTCYDHMAGAVAVKLHDRLHALNWLTGEEDYRLSDIGQAALARLGVDCSPAPTRRRFACGCLDW